METEFATFEISKLLKELGFNEKCLGCYYIIPESEIGRLMFHDVEFDCDSKIKAPLWSQIKLWLWKERKIDIRIFVDSLGSNFSFIMFWKNVSVGLATHYFNSPISAEIEGIEKAVEYLSKK